MYVLIIYDWYLGIGIGLFVVIFLLLNNLLDYIERKKKIGR